MSDKNRHLQKTIALIRHLTAFSITLHLFANGQFSDIAKLIGSDDRPLFYFDTANLYLLKNSWEMRTGFLAGRFPNGIRLSTGIGYQMFGKTHTLYFNGQIDLSKKQIYSHLLTRTHISLTDKRRPFLKTESEFDLKLKLFQLYYQGKFSWIWHNLQNTKNFIDTAATEQILGILLQERWSLGAGIVKPGSAPLFIRFALKFKSDKFLSTLSIDALPFRFSISILIPLDFTLIYGSFAYHTALGPKERLGIALSTQRKQKAGQHPPKKLPP